MYEIQRLINKQTIERWAMGIALKRQCRDILQKKIGYYWYNQ